MPSYYVMQYIPVTVALYVHTDHSLLVTSSITSSELLLGQTVDLHCSFERTSQLQSYNTLQWLDGELPIQNSSNRELIKNGKCGLTLKIHNFTIQDYGIYECRCFNLYNYEEFDQCERNSVIDPCIIPVYCSEPSAPIELLPNGMYH